ncbi:hypothetical protein JW707_04610 [Candidatus Woesearchaeota archaeon]|nr:hypothetical protein [Candidatus Woesearchaeota archaeon]
MAIQFNPEWYANFARHTNEKKAIASEISDLLVGKTHDSCIEIGLGLSPYFAEVLSPQFDGYEIVERRQVEAPLPQGVVLVNADWESYEHQEKADVIIASHVVYYFGDRERAVDKMFGTLNDCGRVFFVVNGKQADYGPIKLYFAEVLGRSYTFTYDELRGILTGRKFREYTVPSEIGFKSHEDLFETLRLVFDNYPEEYQRLRSSMIDYTRRNVYGNKFRIEQKILEVEK